MKLNLPVFKMGFNPDDEDSGVYTVSIVESPAIGFGYQKFNKQHKFTVVNEDKQILTGPVLVADTPIFRNNELGEHYVMFDKETIRGLMQKFFKNNNHFNSNLSHLEEKKVNNVFFYESFMVDKDRGIYPPKGYEDVPDGSWFGTMKVEDKEVWEEIKNGDFRGFSIEGIFSYDDIDESIHNKYSEILDIINEIDNILEDI